MSGVAGVESKCWSHEARRLSDSPASPTLFPHRLALSSLSQRSPALQASGMHLGFQSVHATWCSCS